MKFSKAQRLPLRLYNCSELNWAVSQLLRQKINAIVNSRILLSRQAVKRMARFTCTFNRQVLWIVKQWHKAMNPVSSKAIKCTHPYVRKGYYLGLKADVYVCVTCGGVGHRHNGRILSGGASLRRKEEAREYGPQYCSDKRAQTLSACEHQICDALINSEPRRRMRA